jgi:hypothetical protein
LFYRGGGKKKHPVETKFDRVKGASALGKQNIFPGR